jgi:hypothetical protein
VKIRFSFILTGNLISSKTFIENSAPLDLATLIEIIQLETGELQTDWVTRD